MKGLRAMSWSTSCTLSKILAGLLLLAVVLVGVAGCSPATPFPSETTSPATALTLPQETSATQASSVATASYGYSAATVATASATTTTAAAAASATPTATAAATSATTFAAPATTAAATLANTAMTTSATLAATTAAPPAICTISVVCHTAVAYGLKDVPANGIILAPVDVPLLNGDTVLTVLVRAIAAANPKYGKQNVDVKSGAYVSGIGNDAMPLPLYEKDCGPESGWLFYIDGTYISLGASARKVNPGETVEWQYTCASGRDLG